MEISAQKTLQLLPDSKTQPDPHRKIAEDFEASFLTEMLKYSGVNKTSESFGGGAGEEAFSSMLNDAYAQALVKSGGVGIADLVYKSIVEKSQNNKG